MLIKTSLDLNQLKAHVEHQKAEAELFASLPDSAWLESDTLMNVLKISKASLWRKIKDGSLPRGFKDGHKRLWTAGEIRAHMAKVEQGVSDAA